MGPQAAPNPSALCALFERAQRLAAARGTIVLAAVPLGAPFAPEGDSARGGQAGLIKTLAKEAPGLRARTVALDLKAPARDLAAHILAELAADDDHREVAYVGGERKALAFVPAERRAAASAERAQSVAMGPQAAPNPGALRAPVDLGPDSVVLVIDGARGITAEIARALAKRFRCRLELCGRTPLPDRDEHPELAGARDLPALRRAIIASGLAREPAAIEPLATSVLASREIRATLADLTAAGSPAAYHALDARNAAALAALIDDLYTRHGRIDGVVHGAGVLEDRLLAHKTRDSFERVVATKLVPARVLAEKIRPDVRFIAFFASVSGAFGNRGQIDYSAANDALDKLAWWLSGRVRGKVVSLDWGPWAGAGMISPELTREYERRGVGLIDPAEGADSFLDEILHGGDAPQVALMNASLAAMEASAFAPEGGGKS